MIKLVYVPSLQTFDLARAGKNLLDDPTLATACLLSLFCRRRADPDDELPDPRSINREGWWADQYTGISGDRWGSKLWLLSRAPTTQETLNQARQYAIEGLQWLVDDGVAKTVDCLATWQTLPSGSVMLSLQPLITRPSDPTPWSAVWAATLATF
jgi:phage gp46-like protein